MSVNIVNKITGKLSKIAGKVANGELIPSGSMYQSGTVVITVKETAYGTYGVTFAEPFPDDDYVVNLSISGLSGGNWHNKTFNVSYENKTKNGFVICVGKPNDTAIEAGVTVKWQAFKLMTDENRVLDEQQIAEHETEITAIQAVVPSTASADNRLATKNDLGAIDTSHSAEKNLDFNDFKGENNRIINYWLRYGDTWDNCPTSSFGSIDWIILTVENAAGRVQQTILIQKTNNRSERWTRAFVYADPTSQTVWGDWVRIATSDDIESVKKVVPHYDIEASDIGLQPVVNTNIASVVQAIASTYGYGANTVSFVYSNAATPTLVTPDGESIAMSGAVLVGTFHRLNAAWKRSNGIIVIQQNVYSWTCSTAGTTDITTVMKKVLTQSDLTSTVASGNNSPITSGGVYSALNTVSSTNITLSPTNNTADNVTLNLRKVGKVVTASFFASGTDSGTLKTSWASIGTIPTGYRPKSTVFTTINHANSHNVTVGLQFNSNGAVTQYNYTDGNLGYERSVNVSWIVD